MKIRVKLICGFLILAIMGAFLGATGLYSNRRSTASAEALLGLFKSSFSISSILSAHYNRRHALSEAVYGEEPFTGSLDPKTCAHGLIQAELIRLPTKRLLHCCIRSLNRMI